MIAAVQMLDSTFCALADPTRRGIVAGLARGPATVNEVVAWFDLSQPTISSHLKVLERSGLISKTRVAQTRPCKLEPAGLAAVSQWLGQLRAVYEGNDTRLDGVLATLKAQEQEQEQDDEP